MSPEKQARGYECRRRIVNFILAYSAINRYPPTYEDIASDGILTACRKRATSRAWRRRPGPSSC